MKAGHDNGRIYLWRSLSPRHLPRAARPSLAVGASAPRALRSAGDAWQAPAPALTPPVWERRRPSPTGNAAREGSGHGRRGTERHSHEPAVGSEKGAATAFLLSQAALFE